MRIAGYTENGIGFSEEIVNINGAAFVLFPDDHHKLEHIEEAKQELKGDRDVVRIKVANERDRDDLYRSAIYRDPRTRSLKWYQINADDYKLIRRSRKEGTSVGEYVTRYVLPMVEKTEADNLKEFGTLEL